MNSKHIQQKLTLIMLMLVLFASPCSAMGTEKVGTVEISSGDCSIIRTGSKISAEKDLAVYPKDVIATKASGQLTVRFEDDTRLMVGESSHAIIDAYVYDGKDSNLLFTFSTGTFRAITGKLVKANPEGFNMKTPLATLGIRGSDVYALVGIAGEEVGALDLGPGHALQVATPKQSVRITKPGLRTTISHSGIIGPLSAIPPGTVRSLQKLGKPAPPAKNSVKPSPISTIPTTSRIPVAVPSSSPKPRPRIY